MTMQALGQRIAGNREFCGYTQEYVAKAIGVSHTYISKIEGGKLPVPPSRETLEGIGKIVHIELSELLILAGSFDNSKLQARAMENKSLAALLLCLEDMPADEIRALWEHKKAMDEVSK